MQVIWKMGFRYLVATLHKYPVVHDYEFKHLVGYCSGCLLRPPIILYICRKPLAREV